MTDLEKARFLELKEIGFVNLKGEDREEYSRLKEAYEAEEPTEKKPDQEASAAKQDDEKKDESPKEAKTDDPKVPTAPRVVKYVINSNLEHNGTLFEKDKEVKVTDPNFEFLFKNGFIKEI